MNQTSQFLIRHGLPVVFTAVLIEQMGLPLPALPWLLAAGALAAVGKFNLALGLLATVFACLIADAIWFYLGRTRGNRVLARLCRISLEPDSCARRAQNVFARYGLPGMLVAKFVPGVSTVAPSVAGMSRISAGRFLVVDGIGSFLYASCALGLGYFFSNQIEQIIAALARIGGSALSLLVGFVALFIAFKYWQRQRLLHELSMMRITVSELREMLDAGRAPLIFDLRSSTAVDEDPVLIKGAVHLGIEDIESRLSEFPRDREIVVYCNCPNEVSSARLALRLHRKGFTRVRPLLGGIDAWREHNYPTEERNTRLADILLPAVKNSESDHVSPAANPALKSAKIEPPTSRKEQPSEADNRFS